jgi:hypothetical protein
MTQVTKNSIVELTNDELNVVSGGGYTYSSSQTVNGRTTSYNYRSDYSGPGRSTSQSGSVSYSY